MVNMIAPLLIVNHTQSLRLSKGANNMQTIDIIQDSPQLIRLDIRINGYRSIKEVVRSSKQKTNVRRNNNIYNKDVK